MRFHGRWVTRLCLVCFTAAAFGAGSAAGASSYGLDGKIAYRSQDGGGGPDESDIWTMNPDGTGKKQITSSSGHDGDPVISPDGTRIAFLSQRDGNSEIYVTGIGGGTATRLTNNPASDWSPTWSPDGTKIAFTSYRDGNYEIYVMGSDGSSLMNLTKNSAAELEPAWSPDASRLAFSSDRGEEGNFDIWTIGADGSYPFRITDDLGQDSDPAWEPNGERILYSSTRGGTTGDIWIISAAGNSNSSLITSPKRESDPAWSPSGLFILFVSEPSVLPEIFRLEMATGNVVQLTTSFGYDDGPDWQRVGGYVACVPPFVREVVLDLHPDPDPRLPATGIEGVYPVVADRTAPAAPVIAEAYAIIAPAVVVGPLLFRLC